MLLVGVAHAEGNSGSSNGATQQQRQQQQQNTNTNSTSQAQNAGNTQAITFTSPDNATTTATVNTTVTGTQTINGTQTIKNAPSMGAPNLTSSNDTCMGSTSVGTSVIGFGISFGTTWTDKNCVMLKNGRELWNMGMRGAGLARLCMDDLNRKALEQTGFACPTSKPEDVAVAK